VPSPFRFDRSWHFGVSPQELWATLSGTEQYCSWWPWLREFDLEGVARPAMAWAHDRIVERGPVQFEGHALRERDRLA
jgi:hypothetical protein